MDEIYEEASCIFRPCPYRSSRRLQSAQICTRNAIRDPFTRAFISMLDPAPVFIPLVHSRPFISNQHKCIQFRQRHILMNTRIVPKKRKYLVIQLACASSSNWSSMYSNRGFGVNNGIDVLITSLVSCHSLFSSYRYLIEAIVSRCFDEI